VRRRDLLVRIALERARRILAALQRKEEKNPSCMHSTQAIANFASRWGVLTADRHRAGKACASARRNASCCCDGFTKQGILSMAATKTKTAKRSPTAKRSRPRTHPDDALKLLRADHKEVSEMFDRFEKTRSSDQRKRIVADICRALSVHAQIEEEIFYPEVQQALNDHKLVPEALIEHSSAKALIAQLVAVEPGDEMYAARVRVLAEYVKHHIQEEQNELFPKARSAKKLDLADLGARLDARKQELMSARDANRAVTGSTEASLAEASRAEGWPFTRVS
jgi:hemerythrin superfamily protein